MDIPHQFWIEDINLNPAGKRTNEEPNTSNEEIENKRKYKVLLKFVERIIRARKNL